MGHEFRGTSHVVGDDGFGGVVEVGRVHFESLGVLLIGVRS